MALANAENQNKAVKAEVETVTTDAEQPVVLEPSEDIDYDLEYPEDWPDYYPSDFMNYLASEQATVLMQKREDTRGRLAIIYTVATFLMFILGFVVAVVDSIVRGIAITETLGAILPLISGIFLGTLGFVLGYYFRQVEDEDNGSSSK